MKALLSIKYMYKLKKIRIGMFKKEAFFATFRLWLYEKQLGSL